MYSIHPDAASALLRITISGFLTPNEVDRFAREEQDAARMLTRACGGFDLLVDTTGGLAQMQESMAAFYQQVAQARYKARSIAIVALSPLLRLQLRRVLTLDHLVVFDNAAEADGWLATRRSAAAASPAI